MKRLLVIFVFGAALYFGGYAQAEDQHFVLDGERIIAEIQARAAIIEAQGYVNRCRATSGPFWSEEESLPSLPVPAPLPVASSPQPRPRATVAPVANPVAVQKPQPLRETQTAAASPQAVPSPVLPVPTARLEQSKSPVAIVPPAAKPPVVAAPVEKPKSKVVEQAKVQALVKPPQPSIVSSPPTQTAKPVETVKDDVKVCAMKIPLEEDTQIKGVLYKKGQPLWALIREKDGRVVDKNGRPTSEPELVSAPPRGATLVPFKAPQI